jgi:hypothetical protein
MQLIIDLDKLDKRGLTVNEYLTLLSIYYKGKDIPINYIDRKADYFALQGKKYLEINGSTVSLTPISMSLLAPAGRDYVGLAMAVREQFPKGSKAGRYPWKGVVKTLVEKLKKLDKAYGMDEFSDEDIIRSTTLYVSRFTQNDMDKGMQIAPYFLEKDGNSSLMSWLQMEPEKDDHKSTEYKL